MLFKYFLYTYFSNAYQPIYFVADSTITDTSITVGIRAGLIEGIIGASRMQNNNNQQEEKSDFKRNKKPVNKTNTQNTVQNNPAASCFGGTIERNIAGNGNVVVESTDKEILLGETKYFAVKKKTETGELKIEEIKTDYGKLPSFPADAGEGWQWIKQDIVWDTTSVVKVSCDTCGKKQGIYWETKKPVWNGNDNKGNLPDGIIRCIGRYWHKDSTYISKLITKPIADHLDSIKIIVKKPGELKSKDQKDSYSKTKDINNNVVSIDSLCICFGGINGIPPQFIKGHIFSESAHKNFGGEVGWGLAPSYRYEPYTTQIKKGVLRDMKNNPFYITATTNVNPPNHQHVGIIPYFRGDTITVWQIVAEHSQLLMDGSTEETRLYGVRTTKDTMNYGKYKTIQRKYHSIFKETEDATKYDPVLKKNRKLTFSERADSTNKKMIVYLRDDFTDEVGTKGMKNMIAQTRIASSYGYLQALYTTAINPDDNWKYPEDANHPPEAINDFDVIFPMGTRMQREYLEKGLNKQINNWTLGFEASLKKYILESWNTADEYPNEVMSNVNKFLPKK